MNGSFTSMMAQAVASAIAVVMSWFGLGARPPAPPADVQPAIVVEADAAPDDAAIMKQVEELARKDRASLDGVRGQAPIREVRSIAIDPAQGQILGFCPLSDGTLAVLTGLSDRYGATSPAAATGTVPDRLVWLDAEGREQRAATLPFKPRAATVGPDGTIWVVGGASVARYGGDGTCLATADAPHHTLSPEARDELAEELRARHAAEIEASATQVERMKGTLADLEAKQEGERGYNPRMVKVLTRTVASLEEHLETRRKLTDGQIVDEAIDRARQLHRVAVAADHVFLVAQQESGYGFAIWRCTTDLADPVRIVEGLAGCCGQMDIQVAGDTLAIAENSRHHVRLVDFDGEAVRTFGKTSRDDLTKGFGGCCNPMNTCRTADGDLLTSESNGLVKRYSLDGEFHEVVGVADVQAGCKNSSIGIAADGSTLYYLDVHKGTIVVLEKRG